VITIYYLTYLLDKVIHFFLIRFDETLVYFYFPYLWNTSPQCFKTDFFWLKTLTNMAVNSVFVLSSNVVEKPKAGHRKPKKAAQELSISSHVVL